MRRKLAPAGIALSLLAGMAFSSQAQQPSQRPYTEGPVINVSFIRTKPGMFDRYMQYLQTEYKKSMEAQKAAGLILEYSVLASAPRDPEDHNIVLTTTYKNMAAFDGLDDRVEPIMQRVLGSTSQQRDQQFVDRGSMRESLGSRLYRVMVLK